MTIGGVWLFRVLQLKTIGAEGDRDNLGVIESLFLTVEINSGGIIYFLFAFLVEMNA